MRESSPLRFRVALTLLLACAAMGCRVWEGAVAENNSLLPPARASRDSITLEIFWIRYDHESDREMKHQLWQHVDESLISVDARQKLAENGFRMGVIGNSMPRELADRLELGGGDSLSEQEERQELLLGNSLVTRQRRQLRPNSRWELHASDVYPEIPLLMQSRGELVGKTFHDGQAIYAIQLLPQPNGRVRVELIPELHYGPTQLRYTGGEDGILRQAPLRKSEIFRELHMEVDLAAGEMLVLAGLTDSDSCLGRYFHSTDNDEGPGQKLVVLRLAQIPSGQAFAP